MSLSLPTPPAFMTLPAPQSAARHHRGADTRSLLGGLLLAVGVGTLVGAAVLLLASPARAASATPTAQAGQAQQQPMTFPSLQPPPPAANPWFDGQWTVGAGAVASTTFYKGADDKVSALPILSFDSERLHIGAEGIQVTAATFGDVLSLKAMAGYQEKPFKQKDSPMLRGLHSRKASIDGGVGVDFAARVGTISLAYMTSLNDAYTGGSVDLSYNWEMERDRWRLGAGAGLTWQSADLVEYYVGVRSSEARADRRAYDPKSAILPHVSLSAGYALTDSKAWWLNTAVTLTSLPKEYTDSPLVDGDTVFSGVMGVSYTF